MKFSIIIPNWNGKRLLEKNLPAFIQVLAGVEEIIIVDNGSTDESKEYLRDLERKKFRNIEKKKKSKSLNLYNSISLKVIFNNQNLGFAPAVNQGVAAASGDVILSVNNDVCPKNNFLPVLEKDFADPKVFAVSFNEINTPYGPAKGVFKTGFIEHYPGRKTKFTTETFWVSGGSGAFRKTMWDNLGGFDASFKFYWEDIDLCYRARKRGWQCLWEPVAEVIHERESTAKNLNQKYLRRIQERNQLWFIWKNLTDRELLIKHIFGLLKRTVSSPGYILIFLMACCMIPSIILFRLQERQKIKITDRALLGLVRDGY